MSREPLDLCQCGQPTRYADEWHGYICSTCWGLAAGFERLADLAYNAQAVAEHRAIDDALAFITGARYAPMPRLAGPMLWAEGRRPTVICTEEGGMPW